MSTPGSLTETDKLHTQLIPATGPIDGGSWVRVISDVVGEDGRRFDTQRTLVGKTVQGVYVPVGDTDFYLQGTARFWQPGTTIPVAVPQRPTWLQGELIRIRVDNGKLVFDPTGSQRIHIVQPGTVTQPFQFHVPEFVNEDDGLFGWTLTAGNREDDNVAPVDITLTFAKYKAINPDAHEVHIHHGYNMMSSGTVSNVPWL